MNKITKILTWSAGVTLLLGLYFAGNIKGYYRFKELCEQEGGLRLYQPLERGVGWLSDGNHISNAAGMIYYDAVAFIRYRNKEDGQWYDVYRAKRLKVSDPGYLQQPADFRKPVIYQRKWSNKEMPGETRMGITKSEFFDLRTKQLVASYTLLAYSQFDQDKTILAAPSGMACPIGGGGTDPRTGKTIPSHQTLAIESIFKK